MLRVYACCRIRATAIHLNEAMIGWERGSALTIGNAATPLCNGKTQALEELRGNVVLRYGAPSISVDDAAEQ